ncbi:MAG: LamG-like jellyroll fold domain-containing protein [Acidobacteriota bacterium]
MLRAVFTILMLTTLAGSAHAELIGHYTFEGTTDDVSGNGNHPNAGAITGYAPGHEGMGAVFDGINDFLQLPINISPNVMTELTMGAWVRSDVTSGNRAVLSADDADPGNFDRTLGMDTRPSNRYSAFIGSGVGVLQDTEPVDTANFVFVAVRYDGTTATLFVDDRTVDATDNTDGDPTHHPTTWIGKNPNFDLFFDGIIDEVFLYDEALTDEELMAVQSGMSGGGDCLGAADLAPLEAAVDALEVKLDILEVDLSPVENAVAAVEAKLDDPTAFVSDAELDAQVAALDAAIATRADQPSVDALEVKADVLEAKLDANLDVSVSTRADQASVDALEAKADALEVKLDESLDAAVSSRADQESVDALEAKADALEVKLDESLDAAVSTRADQASVDALEVKADALEVKLDESLDVAVSSRASQASVDDLSSQLATEVARLEGDLAVLQESVDALEAKLDVLPCELLVLFRESMPGAPPLPPHHPCLGAGCDGAGFEGMGTGEVVTNQVPGMTIGGTSDVVVFNSGGPTCEDDDLQTPGDGPGNLVAQRSVLVLAEDGSCQPDDAEDGGLLTIDFDELRGVGFVGLLDIDEEGGEIRTYGDDGGLLVSVPIPAAGDGSWQSVDVGACNVQRIEIELVGSGALTQVGCSDCGRRARVEDVSGRSRQ